MFDLLTRGRPTLNAVFLASSAALLVSSCGSQSILRPVPAEDVVDVLVVGDATDVPNAVDAVRPDVLDAAQPDVPGVPDATQPDVPDVLDASQPDVLDASQPDVLDASQPDVLDAADVTDARDAADVTDARDAVDVTDARDVVDVPPMGPGILRSAARFTILAGSTVSNTGLSTIVGEVGVSPGLALVGIPAGTVVHAGTPVAALAQADTTAAYNYLAGRPCGTTLTGTDLGGRVLAPGVYCFTSSAMLTGALVLDGQGQPNPLFIFQVGSTLVTSNAAAVTLINGARSCGVYWQTGSSATVGIGSRFVGNIVALGSVTLTTGVNLSGRALARTGAVTMDTNMVSNAACPDPAAP